jgi:TetR/AcrR family tetracycline transcriptional repressor
VSATRTTTDRLTREVVLREALALLDDEGFDALTMRRLSERLGVVPMALYRHVANKDDLILGVIDLAVSLVPIPLPELDWRSGLHELAHSIRRTMLQHPGIVGPVVTQPALGMHALVIGEYGLAVMRTAGFAPEHADRGPNAVLTYVLGFVALEVPRLGLLENARRGIPNELDIVYDQLPIEIFPHTVEVRPRAEELVSETQFEYGLHCILDGIEFHAPKKRRR